MTAITPKEFRETAVWDAAARIEAFGAIADPEGVVRPPVCNEFQREVSHIVHWCHENERPCRIIILKPRRKGSSTISVAVTHQRLSAKRGSGCIAGGSHFQGNKLFDMLKVYAKHDKLTPKGCKVLDRVARYSNGSEVDRITLANEGAGRAGGYQVLIVTEVAYLDEDGVAKAGDVISGLVKTVQFVPDTIIILESTANGAQGDFYDRWQQAITFDEFKAGKNGFVRVFYPWFAFEDSRIEDPSTEGIRDYDDLSSHEQELMAKWHLDLNQIAWMRMVLRDECKGDWNKFLEEYPFDDESAFLRTGRQRFSVEGIKYQEHVAALHPPRFGVLENGAWRDTTESEGMLVVFERPRPYCKYVVAADVMTGASQVGGDDPDSHAGFVLRDGFIDRANGRWIEPAVAMRTIQWADGVRFGCWWDIDVLEEQLYRMSKYYGGCPIGVEMNQDRGVVELLKLRPDANIIRRQMFNRRENTMTEAYGWVTNTQTRGKLVEDLAKAVREAGRGQVGAGLEVRDRWTIAEMKNFVVKPSGKAEAAAGHHDDSVMGLGIGLQLLGQATAYVPEPREEWIPPDLRERRDLRRRASAQWR